MSRFGHSPEDRVLVRSFRAAYSSGISIQSHRHAWHQLIFSSRGVLEVRVPDTIWLVPAGRAVWVPSETVHAIAVSAGTLLQTIYVRSDTRDGFPARCTAIEPSDLLRALIVEVAAIGALDAGDPEQRRLGEVLLDQIARAAPARFELRLPTDDRAMNVARAILGDPACRRTLAELARGAGAAERTIARIFTAQTGASFARWRMQARFLEALRRLEAGGSVNEISEAVGYESPSAFIAAFRRVFGSTPAKQRTAGQGSISRALV